MARVLDDRQPKEPPKTDWYEAATSSIDSKIGLKTYLPLVQIYRIAVLCAMVVALWACAGQKRGEPKYDIMENLSARYNIVYHGRKIVDEVRLSQFESYRDNYQRLIPVFVEPPEQANSLYGMLMDSVAGKARVIINDKSRSRYVSEAYLLTGQANYLKGNYFNALEFFTYTANTFADEPRYRQGALVWKARALMQLGNHTQAGLVLDTVFHNLESDRASIGMAFAAQARHYIHIGDHDSAIDMLLQAIEHTRERDLTRRWHFLVGQLMAQEGRDEEAYHHYTRVVKSNAPYLMSFQADLKRIFLITEQHADQGTRVALLRRMLRDDKNKDFKDQIYHQMAELYAQDGHIEHAILHYNLALRHQGTNRYQTTLSYLSLADYYFDTGDYGTAQRYYDSTGMVLPPDFPDIVQVQRKIANLDDLISQLRIVSFQDSLQYLASLNEAQRGDEIDTIITRQYEKIEEDRLRLAEAQTEQLRPGRRTTSFDNDFIDPMSTYSDSRFYFNNPDAMGMGQAEFRRRWGNRPLMDNWKFSSTTNVATQQTGSRPEEAIEAAEVTTDEVAFDSLVWAAQIRERYLSQVPVEPAQIDSSNDKIYEALLTTGDIYRDGLRDMKAAATTYEDILERFPDHHQKALLYYNLYRVYTDIDAQRSAHYRDRLLAEYPETLYSNIIRDPLYLVRVEQEREAYNEVYEAIYMQYADGEYLEVIGRVDKVLKEGAPPPAIGSQLSYLRSLAVGRTDSIGAFESSLAQIVERFPEDSLVTPLVRNHLEYISNNRDTLATRTYALYQADPARERFVDEPVVTRWPELRIEGRPMLASASRRELNVTDQRPQNQRFVSAQVSGGQLTGQQISQRVITTEIDENQYRDMTLLPDSATYFFVINVMHGTANLAPSRFGIGQFNRSRYSRAAIAHEVRVVDGESQLLYVGPFRSYEEVKTYESRILPLMGDIMKIPTDLYNTFIITEENFGTLSDFETIDDYYIIYQERH